MNNTALILRDDQAGTIVWTETANALKATALELSGIIGKVGNDYENSQAVTAQIEIRRILKLVEAARAEAKRPLIDLGKTIEVASKAFIADLKDEEFRLARLVGDYQQVLQAQSRAAQIVEAKRLQGIEDARQAELAKCQTHEQLDAVNEKHDTIAQQSTPEPRPIPKAEGQVVTNDVEFEVFDIALLAKAHWNLVTVEPKRGEIKTLLKNGIKLAGVRSWPVTRATVRVPAGPEAIEI
jgi:hypothetical protein